MVRVVASAAVAVVLVWFGAVQFASDAFCASAAAPGTLPTRVPIAAALQIYRALDRVAPASYVEATLAEYDAARGSHAGALRHALRLPPTPIRNELLGRIALARGDRVLAIEYFFAAPDIAALQHYVLGLARSDPARAYAVERRVRDRLRSLQTHPDAVAEACWTMGNLAEAASARAAGAQRVAWRRRALGDDIAAVELSPLSEKYLLAASAQELSLGDVVAALRWYHRVLSVDPKSSSAIAGLAAIARARIRPSR